MGLRSATPRRLRRPVLGAVALTALAVSLSGCDAQTEGQLRRLAMPVPATTGADAIGTLWIGTWIAAGCIGVLVWGLIIYASLHFRGKDHRLPRQTRYNLPMEIMYTLVPFVILGVLFYYTVTTQTEVLTKYAQPQHTVDVVGQKWAWSFNYREAKNPAVGEDVYEVGTISHNPDLYLVVDQTVRFNLSSPDVQHGFWIPSFHFKMDVYPGRHNYFDATPNRIGVYRGKCSQLCGTYHSAMLFNVHVVSQADYEVYLKGLVAKGDIGVVKGSSNSTTLQRGQQGDGAEKNGQGASDQQNNTETTSSGTTNSGTTKEGGQ
ncbi:MAG: aa3-type cytochrome oxidase subunit II [Propionibacteriaceae bacterium]